MFIEYNKALVRRFFDEVMNAQRMDVVDELFVSHPLLADATRKTVAGYHSAVPDIRFAIDQMIAEADQVVTCWTAVGTHAMRLKGVPLATNRVVITGVYIFRLADGQFVGLHPETRLPTLPFEAWRNN